MHDQKKQKNAEFGGASAGLVLVPIEIVELSRIQAIRWVRWIIRAGAHGNRA